MVIATCGIAKNSHCDNRKATSYEQFLFLCRLIYFVELWDKMIEGYQMDLTIRHQHQSRVPGWNVTEEQWLIFIKYIHTDEYAQCNIYDEHGKAHKPDTVKDNLHIGYIDKEDWIFS